MTDREVMQQALEAMGTNQYTVAELAPHKVVMKFNDAIAALRTALAMHQVSEFAQAQEQAEPTCPECKAAVLYECIWCSSNNYPPQQQQAEPVAWMSSDRAWMWSDYSKALAAVAHIPRLTLIPLYTTPPQRPWVGLEAEEVLDLFDLNNVYGSKWVEFARTVENKLKEKNA